jgi:phage terminase large subunit-like protein
VTDRFRAALDLLASLVLDIGRRWGEVAVAQQWTDARAVLDPTSATPFHFQTRARGFSKTDDLAGCAIAAMLEQLGPASRLFALAADRDQGRLLIESIAGLRARTPELAGALKVDTYRVTATRTGSTLEVVAADAPSAYGLRPAFLVVDELAQWASTPAPRQLWEATTTAMAKVPGARMVVLTSAGDPAHWSYGVLQHAYADPLWRVHEVPGPPPWADPERLAEQRRRLPESSYLRLFENRWTAAEDRLANMDDIAACVTLDGPLDPDPAHHYVIALDVGLKHDRTAVAVCHSEPIRQQWHGQDREDIGRRVVLDRLHVWSGSRLRPVKLDEVERWIETAARHYNRAPVVADPYQATGLVQRLQSRGVVAEEFTFSSASVGKLASTLHILLRNRALALPDDPELIDELQNVRLRETSPGVIRMDHDPGRHDDRAIALAMAAHKLLERPFAPVVQVPYRHLGGSRGTGESEEARAKMRAFAQRHPNNNVARMFLEDEERRHHEWLRRGPGSR